jgi:hypothetical protein
VDFSQRRRVEFSPRTTSQSGSTDQRTGTTPGVRNLRKPRHAHLVDAIMRLDAEISPSEREALTAWIKDEYAREIGDIPLGFVAECHLGPPFVDHRLDLFQSIVDHFAATDAMPEPFARARMLVRSGAYAYVEVFASGELKAVFVDGSVA